MTKTLGIVFVLVLLGLAAYFVLFQSDTLHIIIDGQPVTGPMKGAIGVSGLIVGAVALFCAAIILVFVLAGVGVILVGGFVLVGLVVAVFMFPFMLPLLIPLFLVWLFIAILRRLGSKSNPPV